VEEQLANAERIVVPAVPLGPRGDVGADEPRLVALDPRIGVREVDLAGPDGLDLGPGQHDAGLELLVDRVLVACPPVEGDRLGFAHRG
jgi:hypothetical protein